MTAVAVGMLVAGLLVYLAWDAYRRSRPDPAPPTGVERIPRSPQSSLFESRARVNGHLVSCIFDTGATRTTLNSVDAARVGIDLAGLTFDVSTNTAAGHQRRNSAEATAMVFEVGAIRLYGLDVLVNRVGAHPCLVGMNFFSRLASVRIEDDHLVLQANATSGPDPSRDGEGDAAGRIPARCPQCGRRMGLPRGRTGRVTCVACGQPFHADTTVPDSDSATTRPLDD